MCLWLQLSECLCVCVCVCVCLCVCVCVCVYACVFNNFDWYHNEVPNFWEVVNAKIVMQEDPVKHLRWSFL